MSKLTFLRNKLSHVYLVLCMVSFLLLDLSFRYIYSHVLGDSIFQGDAAIFTIAWSILLTAIIALIPGLCKRILMMLLITVFGVFTIAHAAMFNMFNSFFSFADLMYAGDGAKFFSFTYIDVRKLLILSVLISVGLMGLAAWAAPRKREKGRTLRVVLPLVVILSAGIFIFSWHNKLIASGNKGQMTWATSFKGQPDSLIYSDFSDVNQSMRISGLYQYTARNLVVSVGLEQWLQIAPTHKRLDDIYQTRKSQGFGSYENVMSGKFEGKNVIMIMLESIDTWMLTEEYMPHLYSVQKGSIQFANHYTPSFINAATFNSEFMALTGLIPPTAGIRQSAYTTNDFSFSLPALFREGGYSAESFHSADAAIYDRGNIHKNIGFSAYNSHYNMGMENYMLDSQLIGGYQKMVSPAPFFSFIITFSGHGPYTEEMGSISEPHFKRAEAAAKNSGVSGSDKNMSEYTYAIAHAMETDAFIGQLMEKLEADGLTQDTVLIFFSDHYSKYMTDTQFVMDLKGVNNTDLLSNTPFFIYDRGEEPRTVTKYTSTIDIYPTVANLFNLKSDLSYFVGDDVFGENGNYVMFRNYAWYDGQTYCSADYTGDITDEMAARSDEVRYRTNLSWDTMSSDYFLTLKH